MKYAEELIEIVETKKFPTFWHCVDYLFKAGYTQTDTFGLALKVFSENNMFEKVAFIRNEFNHRSLQETVRDNLAPLYEDNMTRLIGEMTHPHRPRPQVKSLAHTLSIWMIDDTNVHLSGLFKYYRQAWSKYYRQAWRENRIKEPELGIENMCEKIIVTDIDPFFLWFIDNKATEYFGTEQNLMPQNKDTTQLSSGRGGRR